MTELIWAGKYDAEGHRVGPWRGSLPFETVETAGGRRLPGPSPAAPSDSSEGSPSASAPAWRNRLIWGDRQLVLPALLDEISGQVDLIYVDPPFGTGADFPFHARIAGAGPAQVPGVVEQTAFRDRWGSGLDGYLQWFSETAVLLRELLKTTGTLYVHLGIQVSHYCKAVLDEVFGADNFVTEVIWSYGTPSGGRAAGNKIVKAHEYLLVYAKSYGAHRYNRTFLPYSAKYVQERFTFVDEAGRRYRTRGRPGGVVERQYLEESKGVPLSTVWSDVKQTYAMHLARRAREETGYPTQKPEALIERIVGASSGEGDLVLDCFVGSGTTAVAAERLGRRWIAADLSRFAIHTTRKRLLSLESVRPFVVQRLSPAARRVWWGEGDLTPRPPLRPRRGGEGGAEGDLTPRPPLRPRRGGEGGAEGDLTPRPPLRP
ncbi:MAG: site-specific DNA-methyltransferase, partial [Chloroflexi bacterium]|nr:site-specific DNA-methyltransferase [Chloroflexota bacterium]